MQNQIMVAVDGTESVQVHFAYLSPVGTTRADGKPLRSSVANSYKIACAPNMVQLTADQCRPFPWQRTDDPRAVNCPLCQETDVFKAALAAVNNLWRPQQ